MEGIYIGCLDSWSWPPHFHVRFGRGRTPGNVRLVIRWCAAGVNLFNVFYFNGHDTHGPNTPAQDNCHGHGSCPYNYHVYALSREVLPTGGTFSVSSYAKSSSGAHAHTFSGSALRDKIKRHKGMNRVRDQRLYLRLLGKILALVSHVCVRAGLGVQIAIDQQVCGVSGTLTM
jgi:hypothetical protein